MTFVCLHTLAAASTSYTSSRELGRRPTHHSLSHASARCSRATQRPRSHTQLSRFRRISRTGSMHSMAALRALRISTCMAARHASPGAGTNQQMRCKTSQRLDAHDAARFAARYMAQHGHAETSHQTPPGTQVPPTCSSQIKHTTATPAHPSPPHQHAGRPHCGLHQHSKRRHMHRAAAGGELQPQRAGCSRPRVLGHRQ